MKEGEYKEDLEISIRSFVIRRSAKIYTCALTAVAQGRQPGWKRHQKEHNRTRKPLSQLYSRTSSSNTVIIPIDQCEAFFESPSLSLSRSLSLIPVEEHIKELDFLLLSGWRHRKREKKSRSKAKMERLKESDILCGRLISAEL